jgi:hypothetical protein
VNTVASDAVPGARGRLDRLPNGFRLTLRPPSLWLLLPKWVTVCGVGYFALLAGLIPMISGDETDRPGILLVASAAACTATVLTALLLAWWQQDRCRGTFTVSGGRLAVCESRFLGWREWETPLDRVAAVGSGLAVWVAGPEGTVEFFRGQNWPTKEWAAARLQQELNVPGLVPPGPGELAVSFYPAHSRYAFPCLLDARPGRLRVRDRWGQWPDVILRGGEASLLNRVLPYLLVGHPFTLADTDLVCRPVGDGTATLAVAATGTWLRFSVRHADDGSLERVLARFRGNRALAG